MPPEPAIDALVIGGGPAGATAAAVLAGHGHRVTVLEKAAGPRYHVGESLIPGCWHTLDRLGVRDVVARAGYQEKRSVQFVTPQGRMSRPFYFTERLDHPSSVTWQVDRASFDDLLLEHAASRGAQVRRGIKALAPLVDEAGRIVGVEAEAEAARGRRFEVRARLVIDASGRDGLLMRRLGWREPVPGLDRLAIWTYYSGAARDPGDDAGATTIARQAHGGWCWLIPMADDLTSVGVVAAAEEVFSEGRQLEAAFQREVGRNPWVAERLAPGRVVGGYRVTRDWSYRSRRHAADGALLCGDAVTFLDPVFSSGVFLALTTGEAAGEAAAAALDAGRTDAAAFDDYGAWLGRWVEPMYRFVMAFYDPAVSIGKLIRRHPELQGAVTDVLIGDLGKDFSALYAALDAMMGAAAGSRESAPTSPAAAG